jgi:hypothetical protein
MQSLHPGEHCRNVAERFYTLCTYMDVQGHCACPVCKLLSCMVRCVSSFSGVTTLRATHAASAVYTCTQYEAYVIHSRNHA